MKGNGSPAAIHWVLDLQARVHLEEVAPPVHLDQKLDGAGVHVSRALGDADGGGAELRAQFLRDTRPGRLLDQLLVTPLDRAVAFSEPNDVAVAVREDLHLDVARAPDLPLQVQSGRSEGRGRLAGRASPGSLEVLVADDDAHPLATAASGRFEEHRVADLLRRVPSRGGVS